MNDVSFVVKCLVAESQSVAPRERTEGIERNAPSFTDGLCIKMVSWRSTFIYLRLRYYNQDIEGAVVRGSDHAWEDE